MSLKYSEAVKSVSGAHLAEAIRKITQHDLRRKGFTITQSEAEYLGALLEEAARRLEAK